MKFTKFKNLLLIVFMSFFAMGTSFAFPTDAIELDGNVLSDGGIDWDSVNFGGGGAAVYTGVKPDPAPLTIFTQGGSKDHNDPSQWHYKSGGGFPDKDDIVNGYAAAYFLEDDLVLYFGAERFANKGDAFFGFWLFQDQVGIDGAGGFKGNHREHDLFILLDYPQGTGSVPFVQVMEWVNSGGDVDDNLHLLYDSGVDGSKCNTATDAGIACAITNDDPEGVDGWDYYFKGEGLTTEFPPETLFEGRVNVTQVLTEAGVTQLPCFSSFQIETRASRSINAKLWDFVGGEFPLCSIEVTKTCEATYLATSSTYNIDYTLTLTNTGVGSIGYDEVFTITDIPSDLTGDTDPATGFVLTPSPSVADLIGSNTNWEPNVSLTKTGSYESDINGGVNSVFASVSFGESSITAPDIFYVAPVNPSDPAAPANQLVPCDPLQLTYQLEIVKDCNVSLVPNTISELVLQKTYDVEICNTGNGPLSVVELTDSASGDPNWTAAEKDLPIALDFAKACETSAECDVNNGFACNTEGLCESFDPVECITDQNCAESDGFSCIAGFCESGTGDPEPSFTGELVGNFGGNICATRSGTYRPSSIPRNVNGANPYLTLQNQVHGEAEKPLEPNAILRVQADSNTASCALCLIPNLPQL